MPEVTPEGRPTRPAPPPLLGSVPTRRTSRFAGYTFSRRRVLTVAAIVALGVLGCVLPYLTMPYITFSVEPAVERASLFPAVQFVGGLDAQWLPNYQPGPLTDRIDRAGNVFNLGLDLQQIGVVVAVLTCAALFADEINKFFWWPLHLSGWLLALAPVPLLVGLDLFHRAGVSITLQAGWVPLALAGVVVLVATFRTRQRIDTYASI